MEQRRTRATSAGCSRYRTSCRSPAWASSPPLPCSSSPITRTCWRQGCSPLAGVTDFLDGYVARRFGQVTTLGKVLDPTVDRLVLGTAVVLIVVVGAVPVWLASLVLAREALVTLLALVLAGLGARRIDVTFLGKAGTFGLMWCFPLFLWGTRRRAPGQGPSTWSPG